MSSRVGFALAVLLLLMAAVIHFWNLAALPVGFNDAEITDIRIAETVRNGNVSVFYNLEPLGAEGGREGLYHTLLAMTTTITGRGLTGYRLPSVMLHMVMVALVYALAHRLYGPLGGVAALAFLVFGLVPALQARAIGREVLLTVVVAALLLALARALPVYYQPPPREPGTIPFAALGLLLGLGFYVHPAHFLLALGALLFILYMVVSPVKLSRRTLSYIGFAILMMLITTMPYLISSLRLPELSGMNRVLEGYDPVVTPPLTAMINGVVGIFFQGDANPAHNLPGRPLVDLFSGVVIGVGLLAALYNWRRPRFLLALVALVALLPVAFLKTDSPDFQAFAPLLPVLALFFALGVTTLWANLRRSARPVLALALVALVAFDGFWLTRDLLAWPQLPAVYSAHNGRLGQIARHIDATAHRLPTVVCTPTVQRTPPQSELTPTQLLLLMLHNRDKAIRYVDCGTGLVLAEGGERQQVILATPDTLENMHPYLRDWLEQGTLATGDDLPPEAVITLDVTAQLADTIGRFTTTSPVTYAPEAPGGDVVALPPVTFGGNITFLGYENNPSPTYRPGDIYTSIGYWRVDGPLPPDLRLFTHVLADPAAIIAQNDMLSVLVSNLHPRDVFIQITFVRLPRSTPGGDYMVSLGAYQASDNMRLPILDAEFGERGTRLFLAANGFTVVE